VPPELAPEISKPGVFFNSTIRLKVAHRRIAAGAAWR
jgi:hypothetical protein